jgi:hypothetical protein
LTVPVPRFRDRWRGRSKFYREGSPVPIAEAPALYASLRKTPFVSLYGSVNWYDDLAESAALYHWTQVLKQPYRIVLRKDGRDLFVAEPMQSDLVRGRFGEMKRFYE